MYFDQEADPSLLDQRSPGRPLHDLDAPLGVDVHHDQAVRVQDILDVPRRRRAQGLLLERLELF